MNNQEILLNAMRNELPPVFSRQDVTKYMGGIFKPKTLKNMDGQGRGPDVKLRVGKKIAYERESFLRWFSNYIKY